MIAEETVVGRERRRVGGSEYKVAVAVNNLAFLLGIASPKDEDKVLTLRTELTDDSVSKGFPTSILV